MEEAIEQAELIFDDGSMPAISSSPELVAAAAAAVTSNSGNPSANGSPVLNQEAPLTISPTPPVLTPAAVAPILTAEDKTPALPVLTPVKAPGQSAGPKTNEPSSAVKQDHIEIEEEVVEIVEEPTTESANPDLEGIVTTKQLPDVKFRSFSVLPYAYLKYLVAGLPKMFGSQISNSTLKIGQKSEST